MALLGVALSLLVSGCSWCQQPGDARILLVGDSWAQGIWVTRAWEEPFREAGLEHIHWAGESTSIGGRKASDFVKREYQDKIRVELQKNPDIDTVHLIIGGNDVLGRIRETNVFAAWSDQKREAEWQSIARDVRSICEFLLSFPQVRHVVIAGYDYLNVETIRRILPLVDVGKNWDFGGMSQAEVNRCFIEVERLKMELAREMEGVEYVHNFGLSQHALNQPEGAPAPSGPPDFDPFPGGDPEKPMPDACFDAFEFAGQTFPGDGVHPNVATHQRMIAHAVSLYYKGWYAAEPAPQAQATAQKQ